VPADTPAAVAVDPLAPVAVEMSLVWGSLRDVTGDPLKGDLPVDALAVGQYLGTSPAPGSAERDLDEAISPGAAGDADLLLTQFVQRGLLRGELGRPFFLPDPRPARGVPGGRLIAVAGMGPPGRFGAPELAVLVRELCWALGRLGRRHLASALIGAGRGNLAVPEAVRAWVRGLMLAVSSSLGDDSRRLRRVTLVENDPWNIGPIRATVQAEAERLAAKRGPTGKERLLLTYLGGAEGKPAQLRRAALDAAAQLWDERGESGVPPVSGDTQVRVTATLERKGALPQDPWVYRFGAVTASAAIPEREVPLDEALLMQANHELYLETDPRKQLQRGQFLQLLLLPADLRSQFASPEPLVLQLDADSANLHWEMVAQLDPLGQAPPPPGPGDGQAVAAPHLFWGMGRGLTRQLRTPFAPPEPPPPPRRALSVLVVADPGGDLPNAAAEGRLVAELFRAFNAAWPAEATRVVEVAELIGPQDATRTNVLRALMTNTYDVLHYAGHCEYDDAHPARSGWLFGNERLTANELDRIDRVPFFIVSNACESGAMARMDTGERPLGAPSFAEAFFGRGVSSFVCTAWIVDDLISGAFARALYEALLGLRRRDDGPGYRVEEPLAIYAAMQRARRAVAEQPAGLRCWGAYQHYGNPHFRLFDTAWLKKRPAAAEAAPPAEAGAAADKSGKAGVPSQVTGEVKTK
jgi:hypothetical protein